jgi:hypothetical protein
VILIEGLVNFSMRERNNSGKHQATNLQICPVIESIDCWRCANLQFTMLYCNHSLELCLYSSCATHVRSGRSNKPHADLIAPQICKVGVDIGENVRYTV